VRLWGTDRRFVASVATFTAVLWATVARGAFFEVGLGVFVLLAIGAAAVSPVSWPRARWWVVTALPVIAAIAVSSVSNHSLADAPYALAPVVAAAALGLAASSSPAAADRRLVLRVVADVASVVAVVGWLGVAAHWSRFAAPLAQGWRATATFGYANVAAVVVLVGLLCAAGRASTSARLDDHVRCWVLATGLLATQSRSALVALALCGALLVLVHRPMARVLATSTAWALVAFAGLLPAVRGRSPEVAVAVLAAAAAAFGLVRGHRARASSVRSRVATAGLAAAAALIAVVVLRHRVFDGGSDRGRIRLWRISLHQFGSHGLVGQGPHQMAELARGHLGALLAHSDPLQFAQYYGVVGVIALAVVGWRLAVALWAARDEVPRALWATALTASVAVAVVIWVDFPLQVPLIPALLCLVIGATIRPGAATRKPVRGVRRSATCVGPPVGRSASTPRAGRCACVRRMWSSSWLPS
jgi:hypothetical protein